MREAADQLSKGNQRQYCDKLDDFNKTVIEAAGSEHPRLSIPQAESLVAASSDFAVFTHCLPEGSPIPQAEQDTLELIATIGEPLSIDNGLANDLRSKARDVGRQIVDGPPGSSCKTLAQLLDKVDAETGRHLTADRAATLTTAAAKVVNDLGCA